MHEWIPDLTRSLSKPFVVCLFGTVLCVLAGAFSEVLDIYMRQGPMAMFAAIIIVGKFSRMMRIR